MPFVGSEGGDDVARPSNCLVTPTAYVVVEYYEVVHAATGGVREIFLSVSFSVAASSTARGQLESGLRHGVAVGTLRRSSPVVKPGSSVNFVP